MRPQEFRDRAGARARGRHFRGHGREPRPDRRRAPRQKGHRRRADDVRTWTSGSCGRRSQSRPDRPAGEAQIVEPGELVVGEAHRQDLRLPRRGGRLESLQLADDRVERIRSLAALVLGHVLPAEQEAHEILRRHRLDFLAQAADRVAMDAGQQRAVAPFGRRRAWRVDARHRHAFAGETCERAQYVGHRNGHR